MDPCLLEHPLCEDCLEEGIVTPEHIEVDHVTPIEVRPDLRLDPANLRSRCRRHHILSSRSTGHNPGPLALLVRVAPDPA